MENTFNHMIFNDSDEDNSENILVKMHEELILEEIDEQIDEPLNKSNTNFLQLYLDNYSTYKKMLNGDPEYIEQLKTIRDNTLEKIISSIQSGFNFEVDYDDLKIKQVTRTLYEFFVLEYNENIVTFITNFILKNKKMIFSELKSNKKKSRDVSYTATKNLLNQSEACILNNIQSVVFDIIPSYFDMESDGTSFIKYITMQDNDSTNKMIDLLVQENRIVCENDEKLFNNFISPLLNREQGYCDIICYVVTELSKSFTSYSDNIDIV